MYLKLMANLSRLTFTNLELSRIGAALSTEEQKPFLVVKPEGGPEYLAFVHQDHIYQTPFRSTNPAIVSRLKTVIDKLDKEVVDIDLILFLVRKGILLKKIEFSKNKAIFTDIDPWEALRYKKMPKSKVESLLQDLRDLVYV